MKINLLVNKYKIPVEMIPEGDKIRFSFQYNQALITEIKSMNGARWNPEKKQWSINANRRNLFQLEFLCGKNPYAWFDRPLGEYEFNRPLYLHQKHLASHGLTYHYGIMAAEMGCLHPETKLKCEKTGKVLTVNQWCNSENEPLLKAYNQEGEIVFQYPSRIFAKEVKHYVKINDLIVGNNHLFLVEKEGELCLMQADQLTISCKLVTDKSIGTPITLNQLTQNKKPIGSECGMGMALFICKRVIIAASFTSQILHMLPNSVRISNALKLQLMEKLSFLEKNGLKCQLNQKDNFQILNHFSTDIFSVDCSMLMDQLVSIQVKQEILKAVILLSVTLQEIFSTLQQSCFYPKSLQDMELIKFQSMVEKGVNFLQTTFTKGVHDFLNEKPQFLGNVLIRQLLSESPHLIPVKYHNLRTLEIKSIEFLEGTKTYDLTMPGVGNYFDAQGINHQNTGKSLASIEVMELSGHQDWWYVGPRSAIESYKYELVKWRSKVIPSIFTYEELKKAVENWQTGKKAPRGLILDEASRCKNPTAQRSQAAYQLAEGVRDDWGMDGYVIEMSGSPAPKSPVDWYNLCEIAWPGYIKEGDIHKFRNRLAVMVQKESIAGGTYPELVTWRDDERKCQICGQLEDSPSHNEAQAMTMGDGKWHTYAKGRNEISYLYERMKGLVIVKFKKDCLDLPEKQYRQIQLKVTKSIEQSAKILSAKARTTIEGLTNLRELSDGFQYKEKVVGKKICPACEGRKTTRKWLAKEGIEMVEPDHPDFAERKQSGDYYEDVGPCDFCSGIGEVNNVVRDTVEIPCPKEDALVSLLDEHSDVGRLVVYAGFTGSIDRVVKICHKFGWITIRVDGRGWHCFDTNGSPLSDIPEVEMGSPFLKIFQDLKEKYPLVCFVGHPGSAGMGLTLTASPSIVYWSNDFNAESRIQSEDRIHRPGMDVNRGATIIDLLHLPSDLLVLNNLQKKRDLQNLSLGEMKRVIDETAEAARAF